MQSSADLSLYLHYYYSNNGPRSSPPTAARRLSRVRPWAHQRRVALVLVLFPFQSVPYPSSPLSEPSLALVLRMICAAQYGTKLLILPGRLGPCSTVPQGVLMVSLLSLSPPSSAFLRTSSGATEGEGLEGPHRLQGPGRVWISLGRGALQSLGPTRP
eukprot:1293850-Pleurochrysis_carterae.AAC.2